jgi:hypothetical protein
MPQSELDELKTLTAQSAAALDKAKSGERNPVITAERGAAFTALREKMRYIRRRWFRSPPLSDADYPALLLNPPDLKPSPVPTPTGFAEAD